MEILFFLVVSALTIIPFTKLLPHFGVKPYWAFAALIPIGVLILLWIMATKLQEMERR
jgi:hypothetical protein